MASLRDRRERRSTQLLWRFSYWAFLAFETLLRAIPFPLLFALGKGGGFAFFHLSRRYRNLVARNLRIVYYHDQMSLGEIRRLTKDSMQLSCANLLSSLKTSLLSPAALRKRVDIDLASQPGADTGAVILVSHMANWELLAQLPTFLDPRHGYGTHYRPLNNPYIDAHIRRRRSRQGTVLFAKKQSALELTTFVGKGGALAILADQRVGPKGDKCTFFGRATTMSPLPRLIASRARCPVVALSLITIGNAQWRLEMLPAEGKSPSDLSAAIECAIRKNVIDIFWLHARFKLSRRQPLTYLGRGKNPLPPQRGFVPVRVLVIQTCVSERPEPIANLTPAVSCYYLRSEDSPTHNLDQLPADEMLNFSRQNELPKLIAAAEERHPLAFELIITTAPPTKVVRHLAKARGIAVKSYLDL